MAWFALGLRASPIAGCGWFISADRAAGELVHRYDAVPSTVDELGLINHSCDPNTGWSESGDLVAMRDIAAGSELTVDYATCIDDPTWVLTCHCETYRCRQVIEGTDWQIPQLQLRYAAYWSPALRRRIGALSG